MTTALIVGGTSGIGLATARLLAARADVDVHVAGRDRARLDALRITDPALHGHRGDGGDRPSIDGVLSGIGTVDLLIVTLGGSDGVGPVTDLDLDVLRGAFDAKFWAHLTTVQAALPHLSPTASITLIGAVTARTGMAGTVGIAAVNGAVEAMIAPLAVELAPIRVNAVSPGLVDTPWWNALPEDARRDYFAQAAKVLPVGRVAGAEDIAEVVMLVATNPNITGTVVEADGGARLVTLG